MWKWSIFLRDLLKCNTKKRTRTITSVLLINAFARYTASATLYIINHCEFRYNLTWAVTPKMNFPFDFLIINMHSFHYDKSLKISSRDLDLPGFRPKYGAENIGESISVIFRLLTEITQISASYLYWPWPHTVCFWSRRNWQFLTVYTAPFFTIFHWTCTLPRSVTTMPANKRTECHTIAILLWINAKLCVLSEKSSIISKGIAENGIYIDL